LKKNFYKVTNKAKIEMNKNVVFCQITNSENCLAI